MKNTLGFLTTYERKGFVYLISPHRGAHIVKLGGTEQNIADLQYIESCVNACAGLDDLKAVGKVAEMLERLKYHCSKCKRKDTDNDKIWYCTSCATRCLIKEIEG